MPSSETQEIQEKRRREWMRQARSLQQRINLHHWLARLLPVATGVCIIFACLLLWVRSEEMATQPWWGAFAVAMLLSASGAIWLARRCWISQEVALVRLESRHRLHNQLSAAHAGVTPWPPVPERVDDGFELSYKRVLLPPLLAMVFLLAASWVYLPAKEITPPKPAAEPPAWEEVDRIIDQLKEEELFAEEKLEQYQNKLDALRDQPQQEWYEHGSLEAGESLKSDMQNAVEETARNMEWAEHNLDEMQQEAQKEEGNLEELTNQLEKAAEGLEMGDLPLNQETLEQLKEMAQNIDPKQLSQEQLEKLKKKMQDGVKTAQQAMGEGGNEVSEDVANAKQVRRKRPGEEGEEEGGMGGVKRGPGHEPLALTQEPTSDDSNVTEKVDHVDFERTTLGETKALEARQHEIDQGAYQGPVNAGEVKGKGSGGETVWRENYTPEENEVLQKYFR